MQPKVFIIILNWNNWPDVFECLESLKNNDYSNYQVVIVDNGSTQKLEPPSSEIKMIYNRENLGFSGGNNVGIKYALENGADYVLLLNNDTIVAPDFLSKMVETAEKDKKIGMVGSKIYFFPPIGEAGEQKNKIWSAGGKINWLYNKAEMIGYNQIDQGQYDQFKYQETGYLTACCVLVRQELIRRIGVLSDDYFLYYEDTDWSLRARRTGYKCIFAPQAKIWHKGSKSSLPRRLASLRSGQAGQEFSTPYIYYHIRNGLIFAQKYAPWYLKPIIHLDVVWRIIKQIVKLFIPSKRNWIKPILLGIKDFYLGKRGKHENWY